MDEKLTVVNPLIIEVLGLDIRSPSYSGTSSRGPNVDSNLTLSHDSTNGENQLRNVNRNLFYASSCEINSDSGSPRAPGML